jgi:hypothetical protein
VSEPEDRLSYDNLRSYAWGLGFHAEIHRGFDKTLQRPGREAACWYLQPSIKQSGETTRKSLLKFALASEVYDFLLEWKRQNGVPK